MSYMSNTLIFIMGSVGSVIPFFKTQDVTTAALYNYLKTLSHKKERHISSMECKSPGPI